MSEPKVKQFVDCNIDACRAVASGMKEGLSFGEAWRQRVRGKFKRQSGVKRREEKQPSEVRGQESGEKQQIEQERIDWLRCCFFELKGVEPEPMWSVARLAQQLAADPDMEFTPFEAWKETWRNLLTK